jgi:hypothetical protein
MGEHHSGCCFSSFRGHELGAEHVAVDAAGEQGQTALPQAPGDDGPRPLVDRRREGARHAVLEVGHGFCVSTDSSPSQPVSTM